MIPGLVSTPIPFVLSSLTKIKDDRGDTSTGLTAKTRKHKQYTLYTVWYIYSILYSGIPPTICFTFAIHFVTIHNPDKQPV
jgi:hypothetical protein